MLLEIHDIDTSYGLSQVLFGVCFAIDDGEVVTLMGRNGMGKTTTVRSLMGLIQPHGGEIRFRESELTICRRIASPASAWVLCLKDVKYLRTSRFARIC